MVMKQELVKKWMSRNVITISPEATLPDAERLMDCKMIRRLPVVENGRLVGIVTYGDIRNARPSRISSLHFWLLIYLITRLKVAEMMTPNPITISPETTIGEAAQIMLKDMISGLPVVDDEGKLIGIITESDIFRLVVREWTSSMSLELRSQT
jgi:CBS domain-containing protein